MEGSKKFEDAALRGITRHHVWKSRTSDLTVINLRDPSELLGMQESHSPAAATASEVKRQAAPPSPPAQPRPTTGKQESLNALLSKLQLGRPAMEAVANPKAAHTATSAAPHPPSSASPFSQPSQPPTSATSSAPTAAPPALASLPTAPPAHPSEAHDPTFPDLKGSSSPAVGQFEFITGTNIPGQGVVKKPESLSEASSMALFHDPLWGGSLLLDAFSAAPSVKRSPQAPHHPSLAELYATATAATTNANINSTNTSSVNVFNTTPPAAVHTPVASPPMPTMASQPMTMMGGLVSASTPQPTTSYPMYTMPLQYMAQPQFPGGVMYNSAAFFPYGATAMMMPQPQHMPQGYPVAPATMMRPGTNVKAMPFVPGSTM
ncbi:hypothetical protein ABL78_7894 [Leptomonas seymouri]|uniref:Uncharacterized protein n=1 Tax=Leptomonas seymouri TaxID=5684 RepID=A0A0N1IGN6_LEPSE|nr:hypothetical protein ABL78_7894 [Leptomonas seymouri]|eukprot:KPI83082.1 hypothetical protein ABL78_7894 [Leptomonas seymouri]